jgi:hypothetical protein
MSDQIWVIEEALVAEDDTPLSTNGKLLRKIFHLCNVRKQSVSSACTDRPYRPLARKSLRMKIKRLLEEYNKLKKISNRQQAWFAQKI